MKRGTRFILKVSIEYCNLRRETCIVMGPTAYEKFMRRCEAQQNPDDFNGISKEIVDAAYKVHTRLGPGLLEKVYEGCMEHELQKKGLDVRRQVVLSVVYDELEFKEAYRLDLLVENSVIVEIKATERIHDVHRAQLLTYLKLSKRKLGLLITFNTELIKHGISRVVL